MDFMFDRVYTNVLVWSSFLSAPYAHCYTPGTSLDWTNFVSNPETLTSVYRVGFRSQQIANRNKPFCYFIIS